MQLIQQWVYATIGLICVPPLSEIIENTGSNPAGTITLFESHIFPVPTECPFEINLGSLSNENFTKIILQEQYQEAEIKP